MEQEEIIKFMEENVGCSFLPTESSNVVTYGYKDNNLWIVFKGNKVYKYLDITEEQYQDLLKAESKGKWVNQHLVKTKVDYDIYSIK